MSGKTRSLLLSLTILAVILFSVVGPTIVYADGDPPPTTTTTDTTSPPDATSVEATSTPDEATAEATSTPEEVSTEATSTEVTAEATSVPVEATAEPSESTDASVAATEVVVDTGSVEDAATPAPTEEAAPVAEEDVPAPDSSVLNEVPDNTTVAVLDSTGESQPLARQDAATAIATTSDPFWCSASQTTPAPGAVGCTGSYTSFTELLTALAGSTIYTGAGTIFVEQGAYAGGETSIDFNAYNLSNISSQDLTITGGWSTGGVNSTNPSTFNNTSVVIGASGNPWGGSLTIYNLSLGFSNGATGQGLALASQNDINLSNVTVTNSPDGGAILNAGRDVNIINSKFIRNQTTGAIIRAGRNVNISTSDFSNPNGARRQETGLDIIASGSVSLLDVLANNERQAGANIEAGSLVTISGTPLNPDGTCPIGATCRSFFSGNKSMQGSNFLGYGLRVVTAGDIVLASVTASDNFLWGASLQAGGNVTIADSIFNANTTASQTFIDDTGLLVTSGGNVALNNVQANDNRLIGATINAVGDVAINNSTFTGNNGVTLDSAGVPTFHGYGLQVVTQGNIAINSVNASNNTLFGAHLESGAGVAISNSNFSNQTTGSATDQIGRGLEVISVGNVFLSTVTLDNNQTFGASIQAGGNISLENVTATNNGTDGVVILQGGCTAVNGGTYSGNGQYGLNLGTSALDLISATFGNNGLADISPANPATCTVVFALSNGTTVSNTGSSNIFASLQVSSQKSGGSAVASSSANMSLNTFLSDAKMANGGASIFIGKYAYVYSSAGMQIVAFSSSDAIAMRGPFKAY